MSETAHTSSSGREWLAVAVGAAAVTLGVVVAFARGSRPIDPGLDAYRRVLAEGLRDGELVVDRAPLGDAGVDRARAWAGGLRASTLAYRLYTEARAAGVTPTEIATRRRVNGRPAVRVEVYADGSVHLAHGQADYEAAKGAAAQAILALVVLLDADGNVVTRREAVVALV